MKGIYRRYITKQNPLGGFDVVIANPHKLKSNGAIVLKKFDRNDPVDQPYTNIRQESAEQARALLSGQPFPVSA